MNSVCENFDSTKCCGCGACINVCPVNALSYGKDEFGFIRPVLDERFCISCGKCVRCCPYKTVESNSPLFFQPAVYAAVNENANVVYKSSSGGAFYSLAKYVLDKKGIVFGACMQDDFKVCHVSVESLEDLCKIQRSKYVQSFIGNTYTQVRTILRNGRFVLFSGTPCQIAGLNSFLLNRKYENLLTVEVVCHGVPSQDLFDDYRVFLESIYGPLKSYIFRYKEKAENGMKWYSSFCTKKKKIVFNWPEDSYNYYYMKSLIYRDSCYECMFAKRNRNSDITLCDYWHWEGLHKDDFSANTSVSGVIVNTMRGADVLNAVSNTLRLCKSNFDYMSLHNTCLLKPCGKKENRKFVLNKWKTDGYAALDAYFKHNHKMQILKYRMLRYIPDSLRSLLWRLRNEH